MIHNLSTTAVRMNPASSYSMLFAPNHPSSRQTYQCYRLAQQFIDSNSPLLPNKTIQCASILIISQPSTSSTIFYWMILPC